MPDIKLPKMPKSIDHAMDNALDQPSKTIGSIINDWLYLHFGDFMHDVKKKRILHDFQIEEFKSHLEAGAQSIPEDKRRLPDQQLVLTALDEVKYIPPTSQVRQLFANLIISSMHSDFSVYEHVAFIEVAKQLSPVDAQLLIAIKEAQHVPICKVLKASNNEWDKIFAEFGVSHEGSTGISLTDVPVDGIDLSVHHILLEGIHLPHYKIAQSLDNLSRLGLICLDYTRTYDSSMYDSFGNDSDITHFLDENTAEQPVHLIGGRCELTMFGKTFTKVCLE